MAPVVRHSKVVTIPDDGTSPVGSDEWNADHVITGLENVDNTSDVNKPVSTAQAAALALKASLAGNNAFTGNMSVAGTLTLNPASGTTNQGILVNQTGPNTGSQAGELLYNSMLINDGGSVTGGTDTAAFKITHNLLSNIGGQKYGLFVNSSRNTAATNTTSDQIGIVSFVQSSQTSGGTNTGAGAKGSIYAINPIVSVLSGAVNYDIFSGGETDVQIFSGATSRRRFGHSLVNANVGTGAELDGALEIASSNTTGSFRNAILLTSFRGGAALATTGSVIGTDGVVATIANGIDLSPYTITGNFLLGPGSKFAVNGAGDLLRLNGHDILLGNGTTTTPYNNILDTAGNGAIVIGGGGSAPDANSYYRNTRHVFGNVGGATSYLTLTNGATGVQFNGYGTGILHSSAAGVLSSSSVALAADVSGTLPVANGGTNYTGGAWTTYTATVTVGAGSITAQSSSMSYLQIGKLVFINGVINITTSTGSGAVQFNLPVAPRTSIFIPGREFGLTGVMLSAQCSGGSTTATLFTYANGNPSSASGAGYSFSGSYEAL